MENKISISTLPYEYSDLPNEFIKLKSFGVDYAHCDIMDGKFVENITYTPEDLKAISNEMPLPLDVHLMVNNPLTYIETLKSCAYYFSFHCELFKDIEALKNAVYAVKKANLKVGLVVDLQTKVETIIPVLKDLDLVLIMSVKAGAGGQKFNAIALEKIAYLNKLRAENGYSFVIEVDGGINNENVQVCVKAGADIIVSGSFVAKSKDLATTIKSLVVDTSKL